MLNFNPTSTIKVEEGKTVFTINHSSDTMTLFLERFFERNERGKFVSEITKPEIYRIIFPLVRNNCSEEVETSFIKWLKYNKCADLAETYIKKYLAPKAGR